VRVPEPRGGCRRASPRMRLRPSFPVSAPAGRRPGTTLDESEKAGERPALRLLVVSSPPTRKRLPELFLQLLDAGVELVFAASDKDLPVAIRDHPHASTVELPLERKGPEAGAVALFRAAGDLVRFLGPDLEKAPRPRIRAIRRIFKLTGKEHATGAAQQWADLQFPPELCGELRRAFRDIERLLPPERPLDEAVAHLGVDAVLIVTRCVLGGVDPDVIKVARRLGLPSIMLIWSWDNLSSKATLNEHPDRLLVWNEVQAQEAVELHGLPDERVAILGAPNFDRFFDELQRNGRPARRATDDATARILYLGSSPKVAPRESAIFEQWLATVRSSSDATVREAHVVVRPHPAAGRRWAAFKPPHGVLLVEPDAKLEPAKLSRLLLRADVVVALNTSAEIEAAIAGRPVLTFRAGAEAHGQEGSAHFHYLLEANGGFVVDAQTLDEHVTRLAAVLRGEYDKEGARRFVERFVRPAGLTRPVVPLVASAIVELARTTTSGNESPNGPAPSPPARAGVRSRERDRASRVLVVSPPAVVRSVPDVVHQLLDAGVEVIFSGRRVEKLRIPNEILAQPRASVFELPLRRTGDAGDSVAVLRAMADLTRFLSGDLDHGSWARTRAARRLLKLVKHPQYDSLSRKVADVRLPSKVHSRLTTAFRDVERLLPTPPGLDEAIERLRVDAVVLLTRCSFGGPEPDVIKAARKLGLPSIMLVWSWDNLSSKAILNEHPDHLIVWNEVQLAEATQVHGVPRERVLVVGAPNFDRFFTECMGAGARPRPPANKWATILYLGSSSDVTFEEPAIFAKWIAAVRSSDDPAVRGVYVIVRPHPADRAWLSWSPPDARVLLATAGGKIEPETLSQLFAKTDLVVALNTTAEIEAAIAERPVLTFRAGRDAPGQEGRLHFYYLLEEHGGFVIDAETLEEHVGRLGDVLRGDYNPAPMRRFVERFVRPAGLTQPVSPLVASAVLELARQPAAVTR
jgi:CDP-glycerol glycerophosphotransferase (TagB/SpsB family)/putative heme iron utilization protein